MALAEVFEAFAGPDAPEFTAYDGSHADAAGSAVKITVRTGPAGGHLLIFVCEFVIAVLFWWWTLRFLLFGRIGWRALLPAALATGFCLTGLAVFSLLLFSGSVTSGEKSYGPIGVVLVLLYYLIGAGVCLLLGAVFGQMWSENHQSPHTALRQ